MYQLPKLINSKRSKTALATASDATHRADTPYGLSSAVKAFAAAGKVRVLAVSSDRRLDEFADVPTYKERGWNVVRYQWRGLISRAGTPQPVVERLAAAVQRVQQSAEWKAFLRQESQLDGFQGPDAFQAQIAQDRQEIEALKKRLGL